jgi:3-oxoacyl-[acyl-carrier-protein] synthase II
MRAYIISSGVISPQNTHDACGFPAAVNTFTANRLTCTEPDYRGLINPIQLRRMPRIIKMGLASSQLCIQRAGGRSPGAIIIGTGLGCLDNLEKFLVEVINTDEHITSVLPFINSTHNAVAAQVAMLLNNHGYNVTYCHRGFSFESALGDALLRIGEGEAEHVLVGGIDECTDDFVKLNGFHGAWKQPLINLDLASTNTSGTIAGEGSAFFMLSGSENNNHGIFVEDVHTFFVPQGARFDEIAAETDNFLLLNNTGRDEIGIALLGINGDPVSDTGYHWMVKNYFNTGTGIAMYKHLCGEYYTSSSFALWLGSVILEDQSIPGITQLLPAAGKSYKKLLIYNHYRNTEHALILLGYGGI